MYIILQLFIPFICIIKLTQVYTNVHKVPEDFFFTMLLRKKITLCQQMHDNLGMYNFKGRSIDIIEFSLINKECSGSSK